MEGCIGKKMPKNFNVAERNSRGLINFGKHEHFCNFNR